MDCKTWLKAYLSGDEFRNLEQVRIERKKAGFSRAEVKAAKKELGVITFDDREWWGDDVPRNWYWQLPENGGT